MENINPISILDYLKKYAGKPYQKPENAPSDKQDELNEMKAVAGKAINDLNKIASIFEKKFNLKSEKRKSKWLNGGNNKVRDYLWMKMKLPEHNNNATSISIFAEIVDGQARFRISIEQDDAKSKKEDYSKHHHLLDKDINEATDSLVYINGGNHLNSSMEELLLPTLEVKKGVQTGKYMKIQLSRIFTREDLERYSNEQEIANAMIKAVDALIPYYKLTLEDPSGTEVKILGNETMSHEEIGDEKAMNDNNIFPKNLILYGPPGTGKTYYSVVYAVAIIENKEFEVVEREAIKDYDAVIKRYREYYKEDRIAFTTFHQSYGYEEFIEGIKPNLSLDENGESDGLEYTLANGAFKKFCKNAKQIKVQTPSSEININPSFWKVSLKSAGNNDVKVDCFKNNRIRIGWPEKDRILTEESVFETNKQKRTLLYFQDEMKIGDIVLTLFDSEHIDGIGIITGEPVWLSDGEHYPRSRDVKWIATGIKENIVSMNFGKTLTQLTVYKLKNIDQEAVKSLIVKYSQDKEVTIQENTGNYVFIIDEINRGNISKIFGELITLIESSKRIGEPEAMTAILPYSGVEFGVPNNVYILGTMNTADRSIALMDTALRRRFDFVEMMPKPEVLSGIYVGKINIERMLESINERILYLYDREHTIGHAYFTCLRTDLTINKLATIFKNSIIPLLQEYFYEDYSKIQLILGDNGKEDQFKFVKDEILKIKSVFKGSPDMDLPEKKYTIQESAFNVEQSYIQIYE